MHALIFGDGPMGRALEHALSERGEAVQLLGRPGASGHPRQALRTADVVFEASVGDGMAANLATALEAGSRRFVIATTGWSDQLADVRTSLESARAAAVWAPNFSLGTALFGRLVDEAARLYGRIEAFDPFVVEWHRRAKRDRPSGTARNLAERIGARAAPTTTLEIASIRAGSSPGMHLVGFDAPGETVELRITARDRSAYAAGAVAAADWLMREARPPGIHAFDSVVDDLVAHASPTRDAAPPPVAIGSTSRRTP
jgi:4-hydroxy-tetrahydrodipicolinate reductase